MTLGAPRWCGIAVESSVAWPTAITTVEFDGRILVLRPQTEKEAASVELEFDDSLDWSEAHTILRRFISVLAWADRSFIRELFFLSGGQRVGFGKPRLQHVVTSFYPGLTRALPSDPRARLATALYREALGLSSVPYRVLGFFKIINIAYDKSPDQKRWIRSTLPLLTDGDVVRRLRELSATQADVPGYLYESCRCAVAHAYTAPIADPDTVSDEQRLRADEPVIRALAEYLMRNSLGC